MCMLQANTGRLPVLCRTLEWFSVVSFFFYTPETEKNNLVLETVAVSKKQKPTFLALSSSARILPPRYVRSVCSLE